MLTPLITQFHTVYGSVSERTNSQELRPGLHIEEHEELLEALESGDREKIARELADVVYIAAGTAYVYGIDLDAAFREVHRANMSKLGADGRPIIREDGKVLKGPNFTPPNMKVALNGKVSQEASNH